MDFYFDRQRSDFERNKHKSNFMVSFLQNSISLIEVLHHHSRHSRHLRHSNHTGSKLNVLFLSKGVFPNYRNYFVGFLLNVGIDILFLEDFRQDIFTRHFFCGFP